MLGELLDQMAVKEFRKLRSWDGPLPFTLREWTLSSLFCGRASSGDRFAIGSPTKQIRRGNQSSNIIGYIKYQTLDNRRNWSIVLQHKSMITWILKHHVKLFNPAILLLSHVIFFCESAFCQVSIYSMFLFIHQNC
jgi:hypothetical protein